MIKLYGISASSYTRKVLVALETKGLKYEWDKMVSPANLPAGYEKIHPLKKIPALTDGTTSIADSSVICDYLEHKYPNTTPIYPQNPEDRAKALWLEEYADTRLTQLIGGGLFAERIVKPILRNEPTDETVVNNAIKDLQHELAYLESLIHGDYLVGNQMSIADISVVSIFINGMHAQYNVDANAFPKFSKYLVNMLKHPAFVLALNEDTQLFALLSQK